MHRIELTGIPGAGKSSFIPKIKQEIVNQGFQVYDDQDLIYETFISDQFRGLTTLIPSPNIRQNVARKWFNAFNIKQKNETTGMLIEQEYVQYFLAKNIDRPIPEKEKLLAARWMLSTIAYYNMAKELRRGTAIQLVDEGFFHKIFNLYVSSNAPVPSRAEIDKYFSVTPLPSILIKICADTPIAVQRIGEQWTSYRYGKGSIADFEGVIEKMHDLLAIAEEIAVSRGLMVIHVDNSKNTAPIIDLGDLRTLLKKD
jgi:thymidylate kinase